MKFSVKLNRMKKIFTDKVMPKITFYILDDKRLEKYYALLIKLIEKSYINQLNTLIYSENEKFLTALDAKLWEATEMIIPHQKIDNHQQVHSLDKVLLANFYPDNIEKECLFQLGNELNENILAYDRVIEVLYQHPSILEKGRMHFQWYKQQGLTPETIKL